MANYKDYLYYSQDHIEAFCKANDFPVRRKFELKNPLKAMIKF